MPRKKEFKPQASSTVLVRRLGTVLKDARESRKITIREVARETNIIARYIEALETEDYSVFAGETYALGFLRTYAEFLDLDSEQLINLYRGLQIEQSETPLRELTRPTRFEPWTDRRFQMSTVLLVLSLGIFSLFYFEIFSLPRWNFASSQGINSVCANRKIVNTTVPPSNAQPKIITVSKNETLKFISDGILFKLCLKSVRKRDGGSGIAQFTLLINEEHEKNYEAAERQNIVLDSTIEELRGLNRSIRITPTVVGDTAAKVQLSYIALKQTTKSGPVDDIIRVRLEFVANSFLSWEDDGSVHRGKLYAKGESKILEAKNRLLIKIGNGAGVRLGRGNDLKIAGPKGKFVKITYKRISDPLDASKHRIEEIRNTAP